MRFGIEAGIVIGMLVAHIYYRFIYKPDAITTEEAIEVLRTKGYKMNIIMLK